MVARRGDSMPEYTSDLPHHVTRQVRKSMRLEGTAGDIMLAARELYEAQGVAATAWRPSRARPA